MATPRIAQREVHIGQGQRRQLAQIIGPAQRAATNDQLCLREEPIRECTLAVAAHLRYIQASNINFSVRRAPDIDLWLLNVKLLKAKAPQGRRRHRRHQARQTQSLAALAIQQGYIAELKRGNQATGPGSDRANTHRHAKRLAGQRFQARAKLADSRHNPAVKQAPGHAEQQPECQHRAQQPACNQRGKPQAFGGGRGLGQYRLIHWHGNYDRRRLCPFNATQGSFC